MAELSADLRGGLVRLNLDDGSVRVYEQELPKLADPSEPGRSAPVATRSVVADGERRVVATEAGLVVIEGDGVTHFSLSGGGDNIRVTDLALDRTAGRNRLWAGTDHGLLELDPDDYSVRRTLGPAELGGAATAGDLAIDPSTGDVYAAVYTSDDSMVARVGSDVELWTPGTSALPDGTVGDIVFVEGSAYVALAAWDAADGGVVKLTAGAAEAMLSEGELSWASDGTHRAFGAWELDYISDSKTLVIGGRKSPSGGGGLAFVDLDARSPARGFGVAAGPAGLPGDHVSALAYDPVSGRTFSALAMLCSESKLGNLGVLGVSFERGQLRLERPLLSGVRDVVSDGDDLLLALRDENPGFSCDGLPVSRGVVRLLNNRAGEYVSGRYQHDTGQALDSNPGWLAPSLLARGAGADGVVAYTGNREGLFIGFPDSTNFNQAINFHTSLYTTDLSWDDDGGLWLSGHASVDSTPEVNDRSPRGTVHLTFPNGKIDFQQFARSAPSGDAAVGGLPSNSVSAVVPLPSGDALVLCATERASETRDRGEGAAYDPGSGVLRGGIARVSGASVSLVADASVAPDPRAGALAADGTVYVADAERGLLILRGTDISVMTWPAIVPQGSIPKAVAIGFEGQRIISFSSGTLVFTDTTSQFFAGSGYSWRGERLASLDLVGTDEGLRLIWRGEGPPALGAQPGTSHLPAFSDLPTPAGGDQCTAAGGGCGDVGDLPCCSGTTCQPAFIGFVCQ